MARDVVAAAAHGDRQAVLARRRTTAATTSAVPPAADDDGGPAVDHRVPDGAGGVVAGVAGDQDLAVDRAPQGVDGAREGVVPTTDPCHLDAIDVHPLLRRR